MISLLLPFHMWWLSPETPFLHVYALVYQYKQGASFLRDLDQVNFMFLWYFLCRFLRKLRKHFGCRAGGRLLL